MSVYLTVPAYSGRYRGLSQNSGEDVGADAPLAHSNSLARCHPVDLAAVNWDCPGVGFPFSRSFRDLQHLEDTRTAVAAGCSLEQGTQENVGVDQVLRTHWAVGVAARDPPRVVVVADLCHREAEGSKSLWAKGGHKCPQDPAEAVGRRQAAHHQGAVAMKILQAGLLEVRLQQVVVQKHRTRAYRGAHHPEQPTPGQTR